MLVEQPALEQLKEVLATMPQLRQIHCGHIHYASWGLLQLEDHRAGKYYIYPNKVQMQRRCLGSTRL